MSSFIKILYSNKEIINQRKTHWFLVLIIFFVSTLMIATPFVSARLMETPKALGQQFPLVRDSIVEVFEEVDCEFKDLTLNCDQPYQEIKKNGVTYFINVTEGQEIETTSDYVVFASKSIIFYNVDSQLNGDYSLLEGHSFDSLLELKESEGLSDETLAEHFIQNVSQSTLSSQIPMVYVSVFIQYIIYVGLISVVYMAINAGKLRKLYSFKELLTMNILAMFSIALLSALVGLFNPLWGSALFPLLYMARVIFIYFKLMKKSGASSTQ